MVRALPRALLAVMVMTACSVSVSTSEPDTEDDRRFDQLVADFESDNDVLQPGQAECNRGGEAQACGDSSLAIASMVDQYLPQLEEAGDKTSNRPAAREFIAALELYVEGLRERTNGMAFDDNELFQQGNAKVNQAVELWAAARDDLRQQASNSD